jgi:hypothetical protein
MGHTQKNGGAPNGAHRQPKSKSKQNGKYRRATGSSSANGEGLFDAAPTSVELLVAAMAIFHPNDFWPLLAIGKGPGAKVDEIIGRDFADSRTRAADADAWALARVAEESSVYFAINPLKAPLGKKASKSDVREARWLFVDCDPPGGLTDAQLVPWRRQKLAELREGGKLGMRPTVILDSGRGYWGFWRLRDPVTLDGPQGKNTRLVEARGRALRDQFDGADACQNVDRICRLPGYRNSRTGRIAEIVEHDPARLYSLDEFPCEVRASVEGETTFAYQKHLDDAEAKAAFSAYLDKQPPAVEGKGGRKLTEGVLNQGMDFGLRLSTAARMMTTHEWNKKCRPPWGYCEGGLTEIEYDLRGLENSRRDPIGCDHPAIVRERREKEAQRIAEQYLEEEPSDESAANDGDEARDAGESTNDGDSKSSSEGAKEDETGAQGEKAKSRDHLLISSWVRMELPPRDFLMGEWVCTTSRVTLIAATGVGKTLLTLDLAAAIAAGRDFLHWKGSGKPRRVMYLDGEMPKETMKERLLLVHKIYGDDIKLFAYNRDVLTADDIPPLNTEAGVKWLAEEIKIVRPDLIVFDSMMALLSGSLKDDEQWEPMKSLLRALSKRNIGQIWINHIGRDATHAYGDVTREWEMDTIITLAKVDKSDPQDTTITIDFSKKARLRTPHNYRQFATIDARRGEDGWVVISDPASGFVKEEWALEEAEAFFLKSLARFDKQGRTVTAMAGPNYAPAKFYRLQNRPKNVTKDHLEKAMNRLLDEGRIEHVQIGPPSRRLNKLVVVESDAAKETEGAS